MTSLSPSAPMAQLGLIDPGYGSLGGMVSEPDPVVEIPAMIGGGSMDIEPTPWFGAPESAEMRNALATGVAGMNVPLLSDASGLYADLDLMYREPEERTWFNAGLTGLGLLPFIPNMTVWHGSPHLFDKFDISKIGTGEGAQVYGRGLYFAENPDTARDYWNTLARREAVGPQGELYDIPWDEAPDSVKATQDYYESVVGSPKQLADEIQAASSLAKQAEQQGMRGMADNARKKVEWLQRVAKDAPRMRKSGALYEVDLPDEHIDRMLDWNAPLTSNFGMDMNPNIADWLMQDALDSPQAKSAVRQLKRAGVEDAEDELMMLLQESPTSRFGSDTWQMLRQRLPMGVDIDDLKYNVERAAEYLDDAYSGAVTGKSLAQTLYEMHGADEAARIMREDWGLPGIKYLDQGSVQGYGGDKPTRNFVVFDDELIRILERHTD